MDSAMDRWRYAGWSLVFAATLTGCTDMGWCRNCCCCLGEQPLPPASSAAGGKATSRNPAAADSGALFIPGAIQAGQGAASADAPPVAKTLLAENKSTTPSPTAPVSLTTKLEQASAVSPAAETESPLRMLHRRAKQKFESLDSYAMRMRRREVVGGKTKPEELIEARFRREPFSVYFKWIGPEAKGREVVYVHGQHGGFIHTLTAKDDIFLMPAGMRFKIAPDSPMVKGKSRTSITEAGLGSLIVRFGALADAVERGDARHGTAKPMGAFKRTEFEEKVEGVIQTIPPGVEALLPGGGQRLWCFDIDHGLPVLIVTHDEQSREVEYYCHDRFAFPPHLGDDAFDPEVLWRK